MSQEVSAALREYIGKWEQENGISNMDPIEGFLRVVRDLPKVDIHLNQMVTRDCHLVTTNQDGRTICLEHFTNGEYREIHLLQSGHTLFFKARIRCDPEAATN